MKLPVREEISVSPSRNVSRAAAGLAFTASSATLAAFSRRWYATRPRHHLHFTPTGASWLNLVERWFAALTEKQGRRGVHRSIRELEAAISTYLVTYNDQPRPFVWTKTADEILATIARFCHRTSDSGH